MVPLAVTMPLKIEWVSSLASAGASASGLAHEVIGDLKRNEGFLFDCMVTLSPKNHTRIKPRRGTQKATEQDSGFGSVNSVSELCALCGKKIFTKSAIDAG